MTFKNPKMSRKRIDHLILFLLFVFFTCIYPLPGMGDGQEAEGMNLLIITLDTMRADRIGAYGYQKARTPHLDNLAKTGILFTDCYSPVPLTLPAHCSLFTGAYPLSHRVRDNGTFFLSSAETTLAEMMKERDFETYAVVASFVLLAKFGLNQGFSVYDDSLSAGELLHNYYSEITADTVYAKFKCWFNDRLEKKFFAWVHFYDPHAPYTPPEDYRAGGSGLSDMYDGEVAFADAYVGKIIQDLKDKKEFDNTLIIIAGDHGEAFGEHREYGHSVFCYQENLKVPLIFYNSRLFPEAFQVEDRVSLIDILPTLLEMYGMAVPASAQGESFARLLDGKKGKGERSFYIESMYGKESLGWAPLTGIIDGSYKYISLPEPELYDLGKDSQEKNNLYSTRPDVAQALDKKLKDFMLNYSFSEGTSRRRLSQEDLKRLESLGYLSSSTAGSNTALDPKRGILIQNRFIEANSLIDEGRLDLAASELRAIASENSDIQLPQYYELMAKVYELTPDPQAVIDTWKEAVRIFPANSQFKNTLAFKLSLMGRDEEAEALSLDIIGTDDKSSGAFILLGGIEERRGNVRKALEYFQQAASLEPHNVQLKLNLARLLAKDGQQDKAQKICREILDNRTITENPKNADLLTKIGILLTEMNRIDLALQVLSKAASMNSSSPETWNYLGILHLRRFLKLKNSESIPEAIAAFNLAIEKNPQLASAYNGRASALKFSNRQSEAIRDWKKALDLQPNFVDVYFNLGITYLQTGDKAGALKILNECKSKFYSGLPAAEKGRLDRLIAEANR
jgi:arylsulfatase A-like enzyme/Flp pilus assembly protein TadD